MKKNTRMRKNIKFQITTILVLIMGVVGLTIGFSLFSNQLLISSSATVAPNRSSFNVDFSSSNGSILTSNVTRTLSPTSLTAGTATIDNSSNPTIRDLSVEFTEPNQKVEYSFYAGNVGAYDAFLTSILFINVLGEGTNKICRASADTTQALVDAACSDIRVTVKVGSAEVTSTSIGTISGHTLAKGAYEPVVVTIEYLAGGNVADGDFTVDFGDIQLEYSSVDNPAS